MAACTQSRDFPTLSVAEAGQKLLRFLSRRTGAPESAIHRWIRSGQVRVNGHRCKPFDRLEAGDLVRLPPQALAETAAVNNSTKPPPTLPLLGKEGFVWALNKPPGLAVQGGTGQRDSVCARLQACCAGYAFMPAPAHRLDLRTSGVLLVGASHEALRQLHIWFASGQIHKEYLCWVHGRWRGNGRLLRHWLTDDGGIRANDRPMPNSRLALSYARAVASQNDCSLMHIRLFTGRKRQIRAQLAACGHAIVGDDRYGSSNARELDTGLMLHCARLILPGGREFSCLPPWNDNFKVDYLPPLLNNGESLAQAAIAEGVYDVRK